MKIRDGGRNYEVNGEGKEKGRAGDTICPPQTKFLAMQVY
jgi:hypothetical protein